jgi:mannose/fructose/N-acetylgalactosamine-specific phosphotransferase system component IIC
VTALGTIFATLLWGAWVAADATAFVQLLISQPLVAGAVTGWLWQRPEIGLELGALLQLFACGVLPLGGRTPEDFPTGTVAGVAVACAIDRAFPLASAQGGPLLYGALVAFAVALLGKPLLVWQRRRNERLARWCEAELERGHLGALARAQVAGVAQAAALGLAWTALALLGFGLLAGPLFRAQGVALGQAWHLGSPLLWGFGGGLVARNFVRGRRPGVFFWIALTVFLLVRLAGPQ